MKIVKFKDWEDGRFYYNVSSRHQTPMQYCIIDNVMYHRQCTTYNMTCTLNKHGLDYNYLNESDWIEIEQNVNSCEVCGDELEPYLKLAGYTCCKAECRDKTINTIKR